MVASISMIPSQLFAAWCEKCFSQSTIDNAFINTLGTRDFASTDKVTIVAPQAASDSSLVTVEIISSIKAESLYLFVEKNISPLVFQCNLHGSAEPYISLNVKLKESSLVHAVLKEGNRYYRASVHVNVLAQAC
ncbi:MAG: thiosulfate-binding protein SoxY [Chlorobiaceae bacterium]|nr:thiosulfate-binding protein SoxY [Chlorobiaceae bacterium]NTW62536.1 thiosulfate-binding protein SoxY [Chlorobiaceae bacterium]